MTDVQSTIRVYVRKLTGKKNLAMFYRCPITGEQHLKSTGTPVKRDAERAAALWQEQLNNAAYHAPQRMSWDEFVETYYENHLVNLRPSSAENTLSALRQFQRIIRPKRLSSVGKAQVRSFIKKAQAEGMNRNTLNSYLNRLRGALNWAVSEELISKAPNIKLLKSDTGKKMKGKPLSDEQIQQFIDAVPLVRKSDAERWKRLIHGLALSGLRLGEALALKWDDSADFFIDRSGQYLSFRIHGSAQKNGRSQNLPMTPQCEAFFLETPAEDRSGYVFDLSSKATALGKNLSVKRAIRTISEIGEVAGIVTDPRDGQTATAHDLRRSYGQRLAKAGVTPYQLQQLMRHSSISTTMSYYVQLDCDDISADLAQRFAGQKVPFGDTFGDTSAPERTEAKTEHPVLPRKQAEGTGLEPATGFPAPHFQ